MSNGSNTSTGKLLMEPLKTIGAQDLLKVEYQFYGNLRKQRPIEKFLGSRKWARKLVVISQGCVYCYKDEYAKAPQSAFSLSIYERAEELDVPHVLNCFIIINEDTTKKPHLFSCETNDKRKEWIEQLNQAIRKVHYHSGGSRSGSDDGMPMVFKRRSTKPKLPPTPKTPTEEGGAGSLPQKNPVSEYDLESDEDGDIEPYDDIDIVDQQRNPNPIQRPGIPLPDMPGETPQHSQLRKGPETLPRPPRNLVSRTSTTELPGYEIAGKNEQEDYENACMFEPEEYVLDSSDPTRATGLLQAKRVGTFLVRNTQTGPGKVLNVKADTLVKKFKITEKDDGTVSLDKTEFFKNIGQMVTVYTQKSLPNQELQLQLYKGYNS